jgi:hypothetical protein
MSQEGWREAPGWSLTKNHPRQTFFIAAPYRACALAPPSASSEDASWHFS